ncbi:Cullin binding-domain-containing protein [Crassisporium funariophilum]|nr:Cullin binding-domain-containing protein [Crassisporium funariophilum]
MLFCGFSYALQQELPPSKVPTHEPLPVIESAPPISVPVVKPASPVRKIPKNEPPFTHQRALDLFKTYADGDDANVIGPEGFERLCAEADIPLDGALPLILAWQMESKEMAKITKEEWVKGTSSLKYTSVALWSVLLVPKYPIMAEVLEFINERGSYKATNKDLWSMMLEFCETVNPNLQDYEADGAWPTLLDDFVIWKKSRAVNGIAGKVDELVIDN